MVSHMATTRFGTWQELRVIRDKDGSSLSDLSRRSGISLGYLSDLEAGKRWPNAGVTKKLAEALKCPVSVLKRDEPAEEQVPA